MRFLNNVWNISVDIPKFNKAREATGTMETEKHCTIRAVISKIL